MNKENLVHIGQRFGKLVVKDFAADHNVPYWLCQCDCGNTIVVSENSLVKGYKKSCGCMKSQDITGHRYGLLTVIGRSDKRGPRGNRTVPLWECRCDCGAIVYKAKDSLTNPDLCSCQNCANRLNAEKMRNNTGFVEGTQLCRLIKQDPVGETISGFRGVYFDKKTNKWRARIGFRGKKISLGSYNTIDEAVDARKNAVEKYYNPILDKYNWKKQNEK